MKIFSDPFEFQNFDSSQLRGSKEILKINTRNKICRIGRNINRWSISPARRNCLAESTDGTLFMVWERPTDPNYSIFPAQIFAESETRNCAIKMMIVGIFDDNLICIESETSQELWKSNVYLNIIIIEKPESIKQFSELFASNSIEICRKFPARQMQFVQVLCQLTQQWSSKFS